MMKRDKILDKILLRDLSLECLIGIHPQERVKKQKIFLSVALYTDIKAAAQSDDVKDTIDYDHLSQSLIKMVGENRFFLIETLAERIASLCLEDERVLQVKVTLDKPQAVSSARSAAVEIVRFNERSNA